jgi:hypothetical protein
MKLLLNPSLSASLIRNSLVQFVWWVIFYPGFYSTDSFAVLNMAKTGNLNSLWTSPWAVMVRHLSLNGSHPGLVTLFFSIILSVSMTVFFYALLPKKNGAIVSAILQITPLVGAMGITLWHDIPMTSGLLLITTYVIRSNKLDAYTLNEAVKYLFPGMVLVTFRGNGLPTILIFFVLILLFNFRRQGKKMLAAGVLVSIAVILFSNSFLTDTKLRDYELATGWIILDISCYASTPAGQGFVERELPRISTTAKWSSPSACSWFSDAELSSADMARARGRLGSALFKLIREDPKFLLLTHLKRHEYLVPLPIFGLVEPPFIHSTIEFPDMGVTWAFPALAEKVRVLVRIWNFGSFIFAYSGFWLLFIACTWFFTRRNEILYILIVSLILSMSLFVLAGISDARYTLFTLISGQGLALSFLLSRLQVHTRKY